MSQAGKLDKSFDGARLTASGLKAVIQILAHWGCDAETSAAILGVSMSTLYRYRRMPNSARLNRDQLDRLSYILNIHANLRVLFENPENVYGFMRAPNLTPYFNGKSPLDLIGTGNHAALYETYRYVDSLLDI